MNQSVSRATEPLISVVVPAYNAESTIKDAIDSVIQQTYSNWELVICNDASSDGTLDTIKSLADDRIHILSNSRNLGEGATRDKAIAAAKGEWIAFLDADDVMEGSRLEKLFNATGGDSNILAFDNFLICHHSSKGLLPWQPMRKSKVFGKSKSNYIDVPVEKWIKSRQFLLQPLISSDKIKTLQLTHSDRVFGADTEFLLKLVNSGVKLRYVDEPLYLYRFMPGSASANPIKAQLMRDMLLEILPLFEQKAEIKEALLYRIGYRNFTIALKALRFHTAFYEAHTHPSYIVEFLSRARQEIYYKLHQRFKGGLGRNHYK